MKTAIVTGATSDIGRSIIDELLKDNYSIVALGRDSEKLQKIKDLSPLVETVMVDLSDTEAILTCGKNLSIQHKSISLIVHCASIWHLEDKVLAGIELQEFEAKEILDTFSVTLTSFTLLLNTLLPAMTSPGNIIAISGTFENGGKGWLPYFTAKRGLEDLIIGLADELRERKIYVNAISPSDTATTAYRKFFPEFIDDSISPSEISKEVLRLVHSDETGDIVVIKKDEPNRKQFHA